ncbi:ORF6N domain-containing protein [Flavobacterium sp.]|uniref:ORF6N domain-containing protein n=1 Tax=Flavobacterium sp. TaxID=239 RepID=UPI0037BFA8D1
MNNLEIITNKIHIIRNQKVMLDYDLATLYEIETKVLKQSVKRNIERFPEDFMFELTESEYKSLRSQIVTLEIGRGKFSKYLPFAFTEQGVAMLSGVLKSEKAIKINIAIMRTFVILRNSLLNLEEITSKVKEIENQFPEIYKILNYLMDKKELKIEQEDRPKIGYKK